jgi:hypothetical protein
MLYANACIFLEPKSGTALTDENYGKTTRAETVERPLAVVVSLFEVPAGEGADQRKR